MVTVFQESDFLQQTLAAEDGSLLGNGGLCGHRSDRSVGDVGRQSGVRLPT